MIAAGFCGADFGIDADCWPSLKKIKALKQKATTIATVVLQELEEVLCFVPRVEISSSSWVGTGVYDEDIEGP